MFAIVSDIHANVWALKALASFLKEKEISDVIIAGDITNGPLTDLKEVFFFLKPFELYAVPGNMDSQKLLTYLEKNNYSIHQSIKTIGNKTISGFGGGLAYESGHTLFTEEEIKNEIFSLFEDYSPDYFVSHLPPFNTSLDLTHLKTHIGSKSVFKAIEFFQPELWVCGHCHEAQGTLKIGKTLCINPGSLKDGNFALFNPDTKKVSFHRTKI